MYPVDPYLKKWQLSDPNKIAETQTSDVFKVTHAGKPAVLKVLTDLGRKDEANGELALRYFNGVGAVRLLMANNRAHLMTYADGKLLNEIVFSGKDEEATLIVCEVIQKLHSSSGQKPAGMKTLPENFKSLFDSPQLNFDPTLAEGAKIAASLLKTERDQVVLHGDIHHGNIIESSVDGWVAIDPKGLFGERTYDLANVFYNPDGIPETVEQINRIINLAETFSKHFEIAPKRILEFAFSYGCLSACWAQEDGVNPQSTLRVAKIIGSLL